MPTFVSIGTPALANNASVTPGAPAGYAVGDLLVVFWWARASKTPSSNPPSGWSSGPGFADANGSVYTYWKIAASTSETMPTITKSSTSNLSVGAVCAAWTGVDPTTPIEAQSSAITTGTSQTASGPISAITTLTNGATAVAFTARNNNCTATGPDTGWTELIDGATFSTTLGSDGSGHIAEKVIATAGSTGTYTNSVSGGVSGDDYVGLLLALKPAGGSTTDVSISASASGTAAFQKRANLTKAITATPATSFAKIASLTKVFTGSPSATFQKRVSLTRLITGTASASLAAIKVYLREIAATASGLTTFQKRASLSKSFSATPSASIQKRAALTRTATASGSVTFQKRVSLTRLATATGTVTLSALKVFLRTISASANGVASFVKRVSLTDLFTGSPSASLQKRVSLTRTATASGSTTFQKRASLTRLASATASVTVQKRVSLTRLVTASASVAYQKTVALTRTATATGSVALATVVQIAEDVIVRVFVDPGARFLSAAGGLASRARTRGASLQSRATSRFTSGRRSARWKETE